MAKATYSHIESMIKPIGHIERPMKVALYGRSGSGKTTLACTFPKPLLLDINHEEGTDSVTDIEDLKVLEANEWDDIEQTWWYLSEVKHGLQTVILDTATQMQDLAISEVLKRKKAKLKGEAGGWGTLTRQEWGDVASMMKTWIAHFRALPMNVVFIAQERIFSGGEDDGNDEGQITPEVGPRLMPSVRSSLDAAVDIIGHTFLREAISKKRVEGKIIEKRRVDYCLRLGPHAYFTTKVRKPKKQGVPNFLVDPTYEDLLELKEGVTNG